MTSKVIIEVRANEFEPRTRNPHIPYTPDELVDDAVACESAGASAYHFHGRTADGAPSLVYETYRDTVAGIRSRTALLVHPSLGAEQQQADKSVRLANVVKLAQEDLRPDFAPLDMGSSNFDLLTEDLSGFATTGNVYVNTTDTLLHFAEELRGIAVKPYLQIWNVPNLRLAEAFHRMGRLDDPLWVSFGLSDRDAIIAHPGTVAGLKAYIDLIPDGFPVEWSTLLYHGDMLRLVPDVIELGGHVSIGIGDYHYADDGQPRSNAEIVTQVVAYIEAAGREVATPAEAKQILGLT